MAKRFHAPDRDHPGRCLCGATPPERDCGPFLIIRAEERKQICDMAARGNSFRQIASDTGNSIGIVRIVVHDYQLQPALEN